MISRVVLAVDRARLKQQLRRRLEQRGVIVELQRARSRLWQRLTREVCDLIVVSRARIPEPMAESVALVNEMPEPPGLVVLTSVEDDPEDQAQLLAAGCEAVLDPDVSVAALVDVLERLLAQRRQAAQERLAVRRVLAQPRLSDFVSNSPVMQCFMRVVVRVVESDISLLILGETGVGKERLAQAIHYEGRRAQGPFVAINCGALPETLLESELFGHEEGAFTGATRSRRGCFELAHGGTVFLDEIADLPHHLQVKLLRVLQEREVQRLGSERPVRVDVRIMAATNRDIEAEVAEQRFRQDLYYRLGVMTLDVPPLRKRREDIIDLVENYIQYLRPRVGRDVFGIRPDALDALRRYHWPGNVRELINVVERALLLCSEDAITLADLPQTISHAAVEPAQPIAVERAEEQLTISDALLQRPWREVRRELLDRVERAYFAGLLRQTGGRIAETARRAGMRPRSLFEKMRYHRLTKEQFRR